jgi:hypothetical protein
MPGLRGLIPALGLALVLASPMAGAADPAIPLPAADKAQFDQLLGENVVGEALPSPPLGALGSYMPSAGLTMTFKVVSEDDEHKTETHQIKETSDAAFAPGWHYTINGVGELYLQQDAAGAVSSAAEIDHDHEVLTRFTPGDPLLVPGLKAGQSLTASHDVKVYDLDNLKKVSHSGTMEVTYTYIGTYRVTVPAGTFDAALIKWQYTGKVGPAKIKDSQYRFLAPGTGMVAMIQIRSISAMLLYNDHAKRGKLLQGAQ